MSTRPLLAIFVGGKSRRMGSPKGLLQVPGSGQPIVEALCLEGRRVGFELALVGDATPYGSLAHGVPRLADDPPGAGPLGGLRAALRFADANAHSFVVATACDMPRVSSAALKQLAEPSSTAAVLAPRRDRNAPWEPMLARYEVARVLDTLDSALRDGLRSFQRLFERLDVQPLELTPEIELALADWDTPADVGV